MFLAILFDDERKRSHGNGKVFDEMDENGDQRITEEEFVKSIKEGNKYGQNLASRLIELYNARK